MLVSDVVYGDFEIDDDTTIALMESKPMQRIRHVLSQGIPEEFDRQNPAHYSRYEHCVGVMLLLKKLGASTEEQLAGLLHDVSHTAFSHTVDMLFDSYADQSLQDSLHKSYFEKGEIKDILERHGYDPMRISDESLFGLLERSIPELCADRIDYSLREAVHANFNQAQVKGMLEHLVNHNGEIIFDSEKSAMDYGKLFVWVERNYFGNKDDIARKYVFSAALKRAMEQGAISRDDLLYGSDDEVVEKMSAANIGYVNGILRALRENDISVGEGNIVLKAKPRYVNPKFIKDGKVYSLMDASEDYKAMVNASIKEDTEGYRVSIRAGSILFS